jgi:hypothetical protein
VVLERVRLKEAAAQLELASQSGGAELAVVLFAVYQYQAANSHRGKQAHHQPAVTLLCRSASRSDAH